jgi:hypothetical protein
MFTRQFWKLTAERAVKVFAETLAAVLVVGGTHLLEADWKMALSTAAMATLVSVLTSVASLRIGPEDSPSVVRTDQADSSASADAVPAGSVAVPDPTVASAA